MTCRLGAATVLCLQLLAACTATDPSLPSHALTVTSSAGALHAADTVGAGWVRFRYHFDPADGDHNLVLFATGTADGAGLVAALDTARATPSGAAALGGHEGGSAVHDTVSAWVNLPAGRYLLACMTRDSAGHRHAVTGEHHWVEVVAVADTGTAPVASAELRMTDFAYGAVPGWPSGPQVLKIVNAGHEDHLLLLERLHPGVTFQHWIHDEAGTSSDHLGGMTRLGAGHELYLELDLPPGRYIALCLVPDAASGKSHLELGMVREFTVGAVPR